MKYRLFPEEMVLMVIDLQERLLAAMNDKEKVVKNTNILLAMANRFHIPVIVTEQYPKGLGRTVPEIAANLGEHSLSEKLVYSACSPEIRQKLQDIGRGKIVVIGTETHVCVLQTVRDLLQDDYLVYVPQDACCSRFPLNHQNGLELMKDMGAVLTNTETVLFDILKQAGTDDFKALSPLVR
ncbi:MAG: isochorismatase family protein [Solirubrobacterales bacterium]